ncbi:MAG: YggS family pyridoxal phosphate-dependent enzyme [Candidatus Micrarchaeia archaeon]
MRIIERLAKVEGRIARAAERTGRKPSEIRILFATKYATAAQIAELARLRPSLLIGENRVQDAEEKFDELAGIIPLASFSRIEKHMIGTLQSNKAKRAVELFSCIQSVDSLPLAEKISRHAKQAGKEIEIFVEVNNGEEKKRGIRQSELSALAASIQNLPNVKLVGLMGMGIEGDESATRAFFRYLRKQATQHKLLCSMGMSNDFEIAVEEGADMVRIGSAVFKE